MKFLFLTFLLLKADSVLLAQQKMLASYNEYTYTTASGAPLIYAEPADTIRKKYYHIALAWY